MKKLLQANDEWLRRRIRMYIWNNINLATERLLEKMEVTTRFTGEDF
jgi:hypothetical protein